MTCASCGAENRDEARYCDACGAVLAAEPARETRKVVTVLFCDVSGSTALGESLDPEAMRALMARYFEVARVAIERHGGTLEKFIGDAVMAVFGVPTVREDDALRAVRAAQELRDAVEIDVRIGVNTGEVVTGSGDSLVTGDAVNVAARLEQAAASGEVLLGAETYTLVRGAVDVELLPPIEAKGKSAAVTAYRLVALTGETAVTRRGDARLIGRDRERRLLTDAWERVRSERASALFTVLGTAGVGKSRLAQEFLVELDATVLRGRCLSYGDGITYWPVVEVVKQLLGEQEPPNAAIAALLGDGQAPADEIAFAVRKLFEAAAAERPLVVLFDDLHWAEPTFLDLIEHIADWSRDAPILLLCLARPDLLELRRGWGGGKLNATTVLLEPLSSDETDLLIEELLGSAELEAGVRGRIRDAAEGNPLYVEQMLAMVHESEGEVTVPPSIQALLAARLDQLPSAERAALERGSVEGQVFHRGAVVALGPDDPNVTSHLSGLVRKELVRPSVATLPGDDAFRFRHLLIRDAAYDALPKAARADLHERFAEWIEERAPDLVELEEILGYHLEQAVRYRTELGAPPADLAARAALCLGAAGTRAAQRQDPPAARNLLSRALDLLPSDSPDRAKLLLPLGRALYQSGELDRALELLGEASAAEGDVALEAGFFLAFVRSHTTGVGLLAAEDEVREKLARAEEAGAGKRALAQGYLSLANLLFFNGKTTEQLAVAARAKDYARRAGDTVLEAQATAQEGSAMLHGPSPWSELEAHARAALADSDRLGFHIRNARTGLAAAAAAQGRFDEARELFAQHGRELEERGHSFRLLSMFHARGVTESAAREFDAAEQYLRDGWDGLGRLGERGYRSTVGGDLAEPLIELGRIDEALEILDEAEAIGAPDDWLTAAQVRASRALAASAVGDHERAVELGRESVEIADAREYVFARTYYWGKYGRVLAAAGRTDEARAALQECLRLAALKGTVIYADEAREILDALPVS